MYSSIIARPGTREGLSLHHAPRPPHTTEQRWAPQVHGALPGGLYALDIVGADGAVRKELFAKHVEVGQEPVRVRGTTRSVGARGWMCSEGVIVVVYTISSLHVVCCNMDNTGRLLRPRVAEGSLSCLSILSPRHHGCGCLALQDDFLASTSSGSEFSALL